MAGSAWQVLLQTNFSAEPGEDPRELKPNMNFTAVHDFFFFFFGRSMKDDQILLSLNWRLACARASSTKRVCVPLRGKVAAAQSFKDFLGLQDGFAAGT